MIQIRGKKLRRAGAVVEMAVVTPLLLTVIFGIIEYGWVFTIRQGLATAAREGARTASLPGATEDEIEERISIFMSPLGLTTYKVKMTHATEEAPTETVRITIPYADVTLLGSYFGATDFDLGATCSMRKEGTD